MCVELRKNSEKRVKDREYSWNKEMEQSNLNVYPNESKSIK